MYLTRGCTCPGGCTCPEGCTCLVGVPAQGGTCPGTPPVDRQTPVKHNLHKLHLRAVIRIPVFQIVDIYHPLTKLQEGNASNSVCLLKGEMGMPGPRSILVWICLVPGPFQGVGMPGLRYLLGWVCLVHPLEDTTLGGTPPESISPRRYTPSKVHTPVLTPNRI